MDRAHGQRVARSAALFGKWNTIFKRYRDWVKADVFHRLFESCSDEPDLEYAIIDATIFAANIYLATAVIHSR